jgi:hypothetical protein
LLAYVLVPLLAVAGATGLLAARDLITGYWNQPRLPSRSIGVLPPSVVTLSVHGRQQLRTAITLATELVNATGEIPNAETEQLVRSWLQDCQSETSDEAWLLNNGAVILLRVASEENIFKVMFEERKKALTVWLDDYLNRKEQER